MALIWLVSDYELGKLRRFYYNAYSPKVALKAYIRHIAPSSLTEEEVESSLDDFNGEIWAAEDIEDITFALKGGRP